MTQTRKLAAIMFTDIVGYTALMGYDEHKAFEYLKKNREIQKPLIAQFDGRWIKELGDGVMASFNTVSEAVQAAIQIQEACSAANDFQLRIGIHLGEVVFENEDVFGDGVNIASRIQSMAQPGSIYISEAVHHNVSNKQGIQTRFVSEETLKNVKEPLKIYEVLMTNNHVPMAEHKAVQVRPNSIAVLPFANMSSDPEQEYFSDGLTEEIISDLSGVKTLLVISRSSVMTLKGTQKKMKEIAAEVNVRYVLEGSVRKAGHTIKISAQLIDAINDIQLWSDKYTGTLDDVFDIQEKVSRSIVEALKLKLSPEEDQQLAERPITNVDAFECYLKARQEVFRGSRESMAFAMKLIQDGLDIVGPNDLLYAMFGYIHHFYFRYFDKSNRSHLLQAKKYAYMAFELNPDSALGHVVNGWVLWSEGHLQESCNAIKKALLVEPNNLDALFGITETYLYAGKSKETMYVADKLVEIDPLTPMNQIMKASFYLDTQLADGMPFFEKAYFMDPESPLTQWMLASAYCWAARYTDAYPLIDQLERNAPDWAFTKQVLFLKYGLQGDKVKALNYATDDLETEAQNDHHFAFHLAECYAVIGENEKALDLLEYSMQIFYPYVFLSTNPLLADIQGEERFQKMMEEAKVKSAAFEI